MSTESRPSASISVNAAAVVAIVGSGLTCVFLMFAIFAVAVAGSRQPTQMPAALKTMTMGTLGIFLCLAIFGIVTGVGLIRLRNWARISALVWAGVSACFSGIGILIMSFVPIPAQPNVPAGPVSMVRWIVMGFYSVPLLVGVWWLILFNESEIKSQFTGPSVPTDPSIPQKLVIPLPVTIFAWLFIVSSVISLPFMFLIPSGMPLFLFGRVISGMAAKIIFSLSCVIFGISGVGILKLKPWAYSLALGLELFWLVNSCVGLLTPNHKAAMHAAVQKMVDAMQLPGNRATPNPMHQTDIGMYFGIAFSLALFGMLLYYRKSFLEAAAGAKAVY